jgi:hypothetical protein
MNHRSDSPMAGRGYEIRFKSLFREGRGLVFPCDDQGHVDLDRLSERARCSYMLARKLVGREYAVPAVTRALC